MWGSMCRMPANPLALAVAGRCHCRAEHVHQFHAKAHPAGHDGCLARQLLMCKLSQAALAVVHQAVTSNAAALAVLPAVGAGPSRS